MYDIDSQEDFMRFATDHYGELGLSRLNIFASHDRQHVWKIVVSNSYSANVELAIEIATALYKAGVPLMIYDAEKFLKILKEEDYVRLVPESFHNYMGYQEEGCVYELPWEYECSEDDDLPLTKEQCDCLYCRMAAGGKNKPEIKEYDRKTIFKLRLTQKVSFFVYKDSI